MHVRSDIDEPPAKRCKFCDEPARDAEQHTLWFLTLDLDLVTWIKERYPNWFNNKNTIQPVQAAAVSTTTNNRGPVARRLRTPPLLTSLPLLTIPAKLSPIKAEINTINCTSSICSSIAIDKKMAEGEQPAAPSNIADSPLMGSVDEYNKLRQSPPKVVVDTTPLQPQMDKNKESLKVKLMLRRTADQLADIGIYPTLTTSPALHEQRKQLERAKTGDLLKAKIQQRPDRRELERRHILEHEESFVDPSLAEKQRMLKKARLADQLSSQITHRPGPLELIKKNILHTEEPIERIVKQGLVTFKPTSEGLLNRPQHPHSYTVFEDDSQSSEGDLSCSPVRPDVLEAAAASAGIVTVTIPTSGGPVVVTSAPVLTTKFQPTLISTTHVPPPPPLPPPLINSIKTENFSLKNSEATSTPTLFAELCQSVAGTITGNTSSLLNLASSPSSLGSTLSPLSSVPSPPGSHTPRPIPSPLQQYNQKTDAPGKDKNRKKSKTKPITKERTIKFHEYKGPPNSQKNNNNVSNSKKVEEWYQICLNQQNCLVDLEGISSKQKAILPAPMKMSVSSASLNQNDVIMSQPSPAPSNTSSIPPSPAPSYTQECNNNNNNININIINNNNNNMNNNNNSNNGNNSCNNNNLLIELNKLEKMKVSDLKLQLKKRNLPVSGPKPQLIERLKPFLPLDSNNNNNNNNINNSNNNNNNNNSGDTCDIDLNYNSPKTSLSPESEHENGNNHCIGTITINGGNMMDIQQDSPMSFSMAGRQTPLISNEDIVREQQRQIDELQRQLKEKQEELLQMKTQQSNIPVVDKQHQDSINQKLKVKQCLEAKIFKEKLQQIENLNRKNLLLNGALNNAINNCNNNANINNNNNSNINNNNNNNLINSNPIFITSIKEEPITIKSENNNSSGNLELLWHENPTTLVLVDLNNENKKLINGHHRTSSMPSILVPITSDLDLKPPPPQYEEATQKLKIEHNTNSNSSNASSNNGGGPVVKSQELSDVLDILITNGELPESVLSSTPNTPSTHPNMDENNINLNLFDTSSLQHHSLHHPGDENTFTSLILDTHSDVLNDLDCMSPMQSDHHNDIDETAKTLDMLLGQTTTSNSNLNNHNNNSNHSNSSINNNNSSNSDKLIKFCELDFNNWPAYELMKQQLEMEMGDDCNNHFNNSSNNSNSINNSNNNNNNNNKKRDLNPSLQPSLNELLSSSNSNHDYITFNGHNGDISNNNNCDAMDVDFVNSLSSFDFRTIISPTRNGSVGNLTGCNTSGGGNTHHHSHTIDTPPHPFQSIHMNHHNSGNMHMHQNGLLDAGSSLNHHQNGNSVVSGHESIFDLNLDDLNVGAGDQMSWEVDFTLMNCH